MSPFERLRGAHLTSNPLLEDFVFSILSLLVVAVALTAILMPPKASVAAAVTPAGATPNDKQVSMYGTLVDGSGAPIKNAVITVLYSDGTRVGSARTKNDGTWSLQFNEGPAPYTIEVTVYDSSGNPQTGSVDVVAAPGMRWGVRMTFTQPSSWVFVPLPGY